MGSHACVLFFRHFFDRLGHADVVRSGRVKVAGGDSSHKQVHEKVSG